MLLGHRLGDVGGAAKLLHRLDDVVGGHHHHDGRRVLPGDQGSAEADARGGVAAARLADDAVGGQRRELLAGLVAVHAGGDDPGALGRHLGLNAVMGLLDERTVAGERQKLLGAFLPAARPEARAAAAGHDERV